MNVAIIHELLTMRGGAERVTKVCADLFPDAPIYTLLYDEATLGAWFPRERVRTSKLQTYAPFSTNHHLYLSRFPDAVERWDFAGFDLVISSSSAFAHGIITNGRPKHLSYVHSPARYLWDRTHDVLSRAGREFLGSWKRRHLERTVHALRIWDSEAADRPDVLLAASREVQRRIQLYWRRESTVLHPPIEDHWFTHPLPIHKQDYALIVSTLAPYKRIELAIDGCRAAGIPLKIVGEGPHRSALERYAGKDAEFLGYLDHAALAPLYATARVVLFPGEEDFGLVPLEALACGTPVVAYRKGGALETLTEETAAFFDHPTGASLAGSLIRLLSSPPAPAACRRCAGGFGRLRFEQGIHAAIQSMGIGQ